jgi:D-galactose 1-dehydrogenase
VLSILMHILPHEIAVIEAELAFPRNCQTLNAAKLALDSKGAPINMDLDFRQTSRPTWDIRVKDGSRWARPFHGRGPHDGR